VPPFSSRLVQTFAAEVVHDREQGSDPITQARGASSTSRLSWRSKRWSVRAAVPIIDSMLGVSGTAGHPVNRVCIAMSLR